MRFAVLADVHSNLEALRAVLEDAKKRGIRKRNFLFLGDAVGYGPDPNACTLLIKEHARVLIAGNHDWGVLGLADPGLFNPYARAAIRWTDETLTPEARLVLEEFRLVKRMKKENLFLVHGSPREPEEWHYLLGLREAEENFRDFEEKVCLVGHSHIQFIMQRHPAGEIVLSTESTALGPDRYIVNPGSVGQPRDGDPRAAYAIVSDNGVELVRVPYGIETTQRKMRAAGLPAPLIERLSRGI